MSREQRAWRVGPHGCGQCRRSFGTPNGLRIHVGLAHHKRTPSEVRAFDRFRKAMIRIPRRRTRRPVPVGEISEPYMGHPLFDQARELVRPMRPTAVAYMFWGEVLAQDLMGEAVAALIAGADPVEAIRSYRTRERDWHLRTAPLEWSPA